MVHSGFYELFTQIQDRIKQLVLGNITCAGTKYRLINIRR